MSYKKILSSIFLAQFFLVLSLASAQTRDAVLGDYDGDGRSDIVVTRQMNGGLFWFIRYATGEEVPYFQFGLAPTADTADQVVAGDYDGDGRYQPAVVREEVDGGLYWYVRDQEGEAARNQWGLHNDIPLNGYFGESSGALSQVVVRNIGGALYWFINRESMSEAIQWGLNGDKPFTADVDGDGLDELIVSREVGGFVYWFIKNLETDQSLTVGWGLKDDQIHQPADFNGDGSADLIVSRVVGDSRVFYIRYYGRTQATAQSVKYGASTDLGYVGYYTGNLAEIVLYRTVAGGVSNHFVRFALEDFVAAVPFGLAGDSVVQPNGRELVEAASSSTPDDSDDGGSTPGAGLDSVCDTVIGVSSGTLWKPESDHTNDGRENKPLILYNRNIPSTSCLSVYASDGTKVTQFGVYEYNGKYGGRWYSGYGCGDGLTGSQIAARAESASGSARIYVQRKSGECVGPIDPRQRTGGLA